MNTTIILQKDSLSPAVITILAICSSWTFAANLFVLACFYINRRKTWTDFSRLTFSMTLSDFFVSFVVIHLGVLGQTINATLCLTLASLHTSVQLVTVYHILGICIFRNIKLGTLLQPLSTSTSTLYTKYVMAFSWICPLVLAQLPSIIWIDQMYGDMECSMSIGLANKQRMLLGGMIRLIPQFLTIILYLILCIRLWNIMRKTVPTQNNLRPINVAPVNQTPNDVTILGRHTATEINVKSKFVAKYSPLTDPSKDGLVVVKRFKTTNQQIKPSESTTPSPGRCSPDCKRVEYQPTSITIGSLDLTGSPVSHKPSPSIFYKRNKVHPCVPLHNLTKERSSNGHEQTHSSLLTNTDKSTENTKHSNSGKSSVSQPSQTRQQHSSCSQTLQQTRDRERVSNIKPAQSQTLRLRTRHHKRVLKTIGILLLLYNIFTLPLPVLFVAGGFKDLSADIQWVIISMFVLNSGLNPIVSLLRIDTLKGTAKTIYNRVVKKVRTGYKAFEMISGLRC